VTGAALAQFVAIFLALWWLIGAFILTFPWSSWSSKRLSRLPCARAVPH
jgi:hypothetical protein